MNDWHDWPEPYERRQATLGSALSFLVLFAGPMTTLRIVGPSPPVALLGAGVTLAAAVAVAFVVLHLRRRRGRAVDAARAEGRPEWDDDWRGSRKLARRSLLTRRVPYGIHLVWMALCAGAVFFAADRTASWTERIVALGFAASLFVVLAAWIVLRGGVQVTFERFPYLVGRRATFFVATTEGSPRLEDGAVLLRLVGPSLDLGGAVLSRRILPTQWSRLVPIPRDTPPGPDEFIELSVDIPAGLPGSALHGQLGGDPPVRWELLVQGRNRWGRVLETLVMPVYAVPAAQRGPPAVPE